MFQLVVGDGQTSRRRVQPAAWGGDELPDLQKCKSDNNGKLICISSYRFRNELSSYEIKKLHLRTICEKCAKIT